MIHLSLFVSSMQRSVFLAVMKNMAFVTNLESASKSEKHNAWVHISKNVLIILIDLFEMNTA